jgi:hypothetical protein
MIKTLLFQATVLVIVAGIIGSVLSYFGVPLIIGILAGVVVQYGLYNAYTHSIEAYVILKAKKLEAVKLKELSYQGVNVTCPCSRRVNEFIPIRVSEPNYYKCGTCAKTVSVFVATETALITEPIANTDIGAVETLLTNKINEITG